MKMRDKIAVSFGVAMLVVTVALVVMYNTRPVVPVNGAVKQQTFNLGDYITSNYRFSGIISVTGSAFGRTIIISEIGSYSNTPLYVSGMTFTLSGMTYRVVDWNLKDTSITLEWVE